MILGHKMFRVFAAQEVVALLEKIDALDSTGDSSYHSAKYLLREGNFKFFERKLLDNAISKVARRETLVQVMNTVVFNNVDGDKRNLAQEKEASEVYNPLRGAIDIRQLYGAPKL